MSISPSLRSRLLWLWIGSLLGGLAGLGCALLFLLALRYLPIPGLRDWILGSSRLLGVGILIVGWLMSLGILLAQSGLGLLFWVRGRSGHDNASGFAGTIAFSAIASLGSAALFLILWKQLPYAPLLALTWPTLAVLLQSFLLGLGTPWLLLLEQLISRVPIGGNGFPALLLTLIEQVREAVRSQLPRVLLALHGSALALILWITPLLQSPEFRKTHHVLFLILQLMVVLGLGAGHLWLARSALLATLRNALIEHLATPLARIGNRLPTPPQELLRLFRPPVQLTPWIRWPWNWMASRFLPMIDHWEDWTRAEAPAEKLREYLATEVPTLTGPILLALLQILVILLPLIGSP